MDFEIKNVISFTSALKKEKYLGINLIKYIQDLYEENYKILMYEIKEEPSTYSCTRKLKNCLEVNSCQPDLFS